MIKITSKGSFDKTRAFFEKLLEFVGSGTLNRYGAMGVEALKKATPVDTGETSQSWKYKITWHGKNRVSLDWYNTNVNDGVSIALILQYGHATRNGAFIQGTDYINPTMKPIFDKMADDVWKEVIK